MKSLVKTKNKIIIILCLTIICLGIGFAYLAIELQKVNSTKPYFDVSFTNVELGTPVQGGKNIPLSTSSITNAKKTINFNMTLYAPRDEVSYKVTVKNTGTLDTAYNLVWQELYNKIGRNDLVMSYTCERLNSSGTVDGTCTGLTETPVKTKTITKKYTNRKWCYS